MNNIYRVIYNKSTKAFQAVCEYARAQGKGSSTTTVGSAKPDIIGRAFRLSTLVMSLMTIQGAWAVSATSVPVSVDANTLQANPLMYSADMSNQVVAIGESSRAYKQGTETPAIGDPDKGGTAVGHASKAQKSGSVALGGDADSQAVDAVAVGRKAQAKAKDSVAIGADVQTNGDNSQAIGTNGTKTNGESSIALGNGATTGQWTPARIGNSLVAGNAATAAIAIGKDSAAGNNNDIAIGQDAGKNLRPRGVTVDTQTPANSTLDNNNKIALNGVLQNVATDAQLQTAINSNNPQAIHNLNPATGANISIGKSAGQNGMGRNNVAIGNDAGQNHYGEDSVTLGTGANNFLGKTIANGSTETITGTNMVRARQTVAIGKDAMTFGERSIAMGYSAKTESLKYTQNNQEKYTNPESAIAIGQNATAQGYRSVAQGVDAKSQGSHDIAIGSGARTLIIENNGQGSSNIAMGQNALVGYGSRGSNMAIGSNAKVVGVGSNNSFAMGSNSTTMGNNLNVALGVVNTTFGDRSNAIGNRNYNAGGYDSAAVGAYNIINTGNANAVAVGSGNVVGSGYATAIGSGAMVFGANSGVFASASRNANVNDNTYNADTSLVDKMGSSSIVGGQDNFVIGNNNVVGNTSNNNMVLGNQIEVGADKATLTKVDLVRLNVKDAAGNYSTLALIKEGNGDQATYYEYDKNAKANGYKKVGAAAVISPVNGKRAEQTADGKTIIYATETSFVEFFPNFEGVKAIQNAVAIGQNAGVGAGSSVTIGDNAVTTGVNAIAQGKQAIAMGDNSVAIGNQALAANTSKTSQELQTLKDSYDTAKDKLAEKQRDLNSANRNLERKPGDANLIAKQAEAQTAFDTANAAFTTAKTAYDTAFANTANLNAVAIGNTSQANAINSLAIGTGAKATATNAISIGTGNLVEGENSGAIGDPSIVKGTNSYSLGNNNAIGSTTDNAISIGGQNNVGGTANTRDGNGIITTAGGLTDGVAANRSMVIGFKNNVNADDVMVLGNNITATTSNNVILGNNAADAKATNVNNATVNGIAYSGFAGNTSYAAVSVGAEGKERQIKNVAAGAITETSTDAINGSQLYMVAKGTLDQMPVVYTNKDGNKLIKVGDNFYPAGSVISPNGDVYPAGTVLADNGQPTDPSIKPINPTEAGDVIASMNDGSNNTTSPMTLTNIKSNLAPVTTATTEQPNANHPVLLEENANNAATLGDVLNAGWNLQGNGEAKDVVVHADTVNFVNGAGTTAIVDTDGKTSTIKYDVNVDGDTITTKTDPNDPNKTVITANTTALTNTDGKVNTPANTSALATAGDIANAINNSGFKLTSSNDGTNTGVTELVNPSDTVTINGGKNITVSQTGSTVAVATKDEVTFNSVIVGNTSPVVINEAGINAGNKPISNVADGKAPQDAVNVRQLNAVKETVVSTDKSITVTSNKTNADGGKEFDLSVNVDGDTIINDNGVLKAKALETTDLTVNNGSVVKPSATTPANGNKFVTADEIADTINQAGFTVTKAGTENADSLVNAGDNLNFKDGTQTTVDVKGNTIQVNINTATLASPTSDITNVDAGKLTAPTTDGVVTASNLVDAINNTGFKLKTSATDGKKEIGTANNGELINPSDTVEMIAGKNLTVQQDTDGKVTFATKDDVTFTNVTSDTIKVPTGVTDKPITISRDGIDMANKPVTNINNGLTTYQDVTKSTNGLVDLSTPTDGSAPKVANSTAATVGNLRNMGWIVSSDKNTNNLGTAYSDQVKNANEVKFVGTGLATVSGKTGTDGVRTITVDVSAQNVVNNAQTPVVYTTADGTKVYKQPDGAFKKADGSTVDAGDVIASMNNPQNSTTAPMALNNVAGNLDGAKTGTTAPNTVGAAPANLNNSAAATVGDVLNAGFNLQGNGKARDFVKPYDTVNFADGTNTKVDVSTDADGKVSTIKVNVDAQSVTNNSQLPVVYTDTDGNQVYPVVDENGNVTYNTKPDGTGTEVAPTNVITSINGPEGITKPTTLTNVASNLPNTYNNDVYNTTNQPVTTAQALPADLNVNNAATVGDVLNAGWNLQGNGKARDFVKPYDTVNFADGAGTTAVVTTATDGKSSEVKYDVNVDNASIVIENGVLKATAQAPQTTTLTDANNDGKVDAPITADADKFVKADDIANAINNSGFTLKTSANGGTKALGNDEVINPGDVIDMAAGKNLTVKQDVNGKVTYALADDIAVNQITSNNVAINPNGTLTVGANSTVDMGGNKITNVAVGTAPTDAVNVSQLTQAVAGSKENVVSTNKTVSVTPTVAQNGSTTFDLAVNVGSGLTVNSNTGAIDVKTDGTTINTTPTGELRVNTTPLTSNANGTVNTPANPNAIATAGDVANAINNSGWNLQNNGEQRDLVKPSDKVDFINGTGTTAVVITAADGNSSTVTYNVNADNKTTKITYVDASGSPVYAITDAQGNVSYNTAQDGSGTAVAPSVVTSQISAIIPTTNINHIVGGTDINGNVVDGNGSAVTTVIDPKKDVNDPSNQQPITLTADEALRTYDAAGVGTVETNSVLTAIKNINEQGTKYIHFNGGERSVGGVRGDDDDQSQANGAKSTAIGFRTTADGNASVAIGNEAHALGAWSIAIGDKAQAAGVQSIAVGTGNVVTGSHSGAIGDPNTVSGSVSYALGNNNNVATNNTFVVGNNVVATAENSVALGNNTAITQATGKTLNTDGSQGVSATTAGATGTVETATVGHMTYGGFEGATANGAVSVGASGSERRIQNVAAGEISRTSTDAINGSQLHAVAEGLGNRINHIDARIDDVEDDANAGVSSAMAMATLPQAYLPGKSMLTGGIASYNGEGAVAVGFSKLSDNGRWVLKMSGSADTQGNVGGAVGAGFHF